MFKTTRAFRERGLGWYRREDIPQRTVRCSCHSVGSHKEVAMYVMGRIGIMGLGIVLAGYLSGGPVFAENKPTKPPIEDGSRVIITSPKEGGGGGEASHFLFMKIKYEKI